ncbi:transposase family protein [Nonomuraea sp. NPDC050478]|uniref:transposase family protein n=1 Tax=Nonomuraea sp. NPDC050478 TaxID=3364365 RepID=UPI0037A4980E
MSITQLLAVVFPHLAAVRVERVHRIGVTVQVKAATTEPKGECPACGWESVRVHSRYERRLPDLPVAGQEVLGQVQVRRFFCDNTAWAKRTFAEQVPGRDGHRPAERHAITPRNLNLCTAIHVREGAYRHLCPRANPEALRLKCEHSIRLSMNASGRNHSM